ncbi:hypothetical protein A7Q09_06165 [Methylacidiphilum sp. Yel]|jgi:heme/copper-type cytochrome/quinol oxidase subunit 2|uniref:hypothetical protein n=1 Tax=Methylacidiphilum sp. Yel TaxID=1847730 RepID=UPI00106B7D0B|nr:hypothetical protein [Methylacidiphilum sp. Yel]TFE69071.1 hypothetical protein A7Q09_06165 [Methylacidiphilum sp. Yel]
MKSGIFGYVGLLLVLTIDKAFSCGICSVPNSPATKGMLPAVLFLLGLLGLVFGLFISFFIKMNRKEAALERERQVEDATKPQETSPQFSVERGV